MCWGFKGEVIFWTDRLWGGWRYNVGSIWDADVVGKVVFKGVIKEDLVVL